MTAALSSHALDQIFRSARTFNGWADRPVEDSTYDAESFARLAELGGWRVAELWTDAERLFAVFGLVEKKGATADGFNRAVYERLKPGGSEFGEVLALAAAA